MNRYVSLYRWQLIGMSLLVLVALLFMFFVQAPSLSLPQIQRPAANEVAPGAANVELPTGIHAADRKFYGNGYAIYRDAAANSYTLDTVHPADRKFFDTGASIVGPIEAPDPLAHAHPADRKFFTSTYMWGSQDE